MADHDPMCPRSSMVPPYVGDRCECWLIDRVRADMLERIRRYHERCHAERRAWERDPEDLGRSDLWLARAMGVSALLDHLQGEEGA